MAERIESTSPDASARAVAHFAGLSAGVRGCAIVGPHGVAATDRGERWSEAARALLDAADRAAGQPATHAHVATEEGEVFAVRSGQLAMVAVTSRFTLASLMFADMRAALREAHGPDESPPAARAA